MSVIGTFASWASQSTAVNKLTIGIVKGQIDEVYNEAQTVMPGDNVSKIVNVKNTGTADSVVRIKLYKAWGDSRDDNGNLLVNDSLSGDSIRIITDSDKWFFDETDGYYYYKGVLAPGETTAEPLMSGFNVDSALQNSYAGKTADIRIQLECVQAAGGGVSFWNKTLTELGIVYEPAEKPIPSLTADFISPQKNFKFDASDGDLFVNFKELIPGENRSEVLTVSNKYSEKTDIYLRAELYDNDISEADKEKVIAFLKDYATITITDENGNTVYSGSVWNDEAGADSMKNKVMLGTFSPQTAKNYSVSIYIDPQANNQYASLLGEVKWIFEASGKGSGDIGDVSTTKTATTETTEHSTETSSTTNATTQEHTTSENTEPATTQRTTSVTSTETTSKPNGNYSSESEVPKTGDRFPTVALIVIAVCSGVALIVFAIKRKKDKDIDVHTDIEIK